MKVIIYAPHKNEVDSLARDLRAVGHQVLAQTSNPNHFQHLRGEFGARCVALDFPMTASNCPLAAGACAPSLFGQMAAQGYRMRTPPPVWEAALELCAPPTSLENLVDNAAEAFEQFMGGRPAGLSRLPAAWLAGLPRILKQLGGPDGCIPWFVAGVAAKHGILEMELHQEGALPPPLIGQHCRRVELRKAMNLGLYPSFWRPLKRRYWQLLYHHRPELRELLKGFPPC